MWGGWLAGLTVSSRAPDPKHLTTYWIFRVWYLSRTIQSTVHSFLSVLVFQTFLSIFGFCLSFYFDTFETLYHPCPDFLSFSTLMAYSHFLFIIFRFSAYCHYNHCFCDFSACWFLCSLSKFAVDCHDIIRHLSAFRHFSLFYCTHYFE